MIVLGAEADLPAEELVDMVRATMNHLGGEVTEVDESDDAVRFRFRIPAMSIPTLGAYLASGGLLLDDESEQLMGGIASGVHVSTLAGTLVVRLDSDDEEIPGLH
ncbi:MAG: hypothetical protein U0163_09925 [Gemmatimonadaceae bacterium]